MANKEMAVLILKYFFKIIGGTVVPPLDASKRYKMAIPEANTAPPIITARTASSTTL